jgi:hypothetical protein
MPPQNSCPVQRIQSYLAIRSFASSQACCETMSLEQQARIMLTSHAKTEGGFEYAGEYYTACRAFLSGTDPSMPSKTLLQLNDLNIDKLLKLNAGGGSKIHTGDGLITKAKRTAPIFRRRHKYQSSKYCRSRKCSTSPKAGARLASQQCQLQQWDLHSIGT